MGAGLARSITPEPNGRKRNRPGTNFPGFGQLVIILGAQTKSKSKVVPAKSRPCCHPAWGPRATLASLTSEWTHFLLLLKDRPGTGLCFPARLQGDRSFLKQMMLYTHFSEQI